VEHAIEHLKADKCRQRDMKECSLMRASSLAMQIMKHFDLGPGNTNCLVDLCKAAVRRDIRMSTAMRSCSGTCHTALNEGSFVWELPRSKPSEG
jgi:hypothetical protein